MLRVSVVDGTTLTGQLAPDGSTYVVLATGSTIVGATHPSGALWVTNSDGTQLLPARAPDGSLYVTEADVWGSGTRVTVASGDLTPGGGGGGTVGSPMGLLLALTYAA